MLKINKTLKTLAVGLSLVAAKRAVLLLLVSHQKAC